MVLDETLNLDSLLLKLRDKVKAEWYQFGEAIGVPKEYLEKLEGLSEEGCLVKLLEFWLSYHPDRPTWKELADALEYIRDYQLANNLKKVYDLAG